MPRYISPENIDALRTLVEGEGWKLGKPFYKEKLDVDSMRIKEPRRILWSRSFAWVNIHPEGRLFSPVEVRMALTKKNFHRADRLYEQLSTIFKEFESQSGMTAYVASSPLENLGL